MELITTKQTLEDLKEKYVLKEENKTIENFDFTNELKGTKNIEYSINYEFQKGIETKLELGEISNENWKYIALSGDAIEIFGFEEEMIGDWNESFSIVDLDEIDDYKEIAVRVEGDYDGEDSDFIRFYRIINNKLELIGTVRAKDFYRENNKFYDAESYLDFITEKVMTNYYILKDGKLERVYKFEDGKNSYTTEEQEADYSLFSNYTYTLSCDMYRSINEVVKTGEKVKILDMDYKNIFFGDCKIQLENGEIVEVTKTYAGRIF